MTGLAGIFLADILPILLIAGAGYLLARTVPIDIRTVTNVAFYVLLPCLTFHMLVTSPVNARELGLMAILATVIIAAMGVVGALAGRLLGLSRTALSAFLITVMFSNGGNYGLPLVSFAFGDAALAYATVFFLTGAVLTYVAGGLIAAAGRQPLGAAVAAALRMPVLWAAIGAIAIRATGTPVTPSLMRPIGLLRDAALPVMILILGLQLRRAAWPKRLTPVLVAVAVSLVVTPLIALACTSALGLTGPARQAVVMLSSMPVAVTTTILAIEYDVEPDMVTSAVFVSTLVSPFTLAPIISFLR